MEIIHDFGNTGITAKKDSDGIFLANGTGGYASLCSRNISKYQGVFFEEEGECYKAIENIIIPGAVTAIRNKFTSAARTRGDAGEFFYMPGGLNAFVYELSKEREISIILDCRKQLDFRKWGRFYRVYHKEGLLFVKYTKKEHANDSKKGGRREKGYEIFIAISPDRPDFEKTGMWEKAEYEFDRRRNDESEMHVYNAVRINASRVVFGFGTTEKKAAGNLAEALNVKKPRELPNAKVRFILNSEVHMAYLCAQQSLHKLYVRLGNKKGFFAGLPWFNQLWSRDELVSVGALISLKEYELAKEILMKYLGLLQKDGRLPNRDPATETGNADAVGWMFARFYELLVKLFAKNQLHRHFEKKELHAIKHALEKSISSIVSNYSKGELIENKNQETWCDTILGGREGARIEIQALQLAMYELLRWLCMILKDNAGKKYALHKMESLRNAVKEKFWNGHYLRDGADDNTIRPNVFLAYYVYPRLLTASQWRKCFDNILPRLFTGFGLSSIDMHDRRFQPAHTGTDDKSYHNGDSWYWINNIAAICLYRAGKFRYAKYLNGILNGSTDDILWCGIPGCASEISSASKQESFGCFNQAWSDATYIEMIDEMF